MQYEYLDDCIDNFPLLDCHKYIQFGKTNQYIDLIYSEVYFPVHMSSLVTRLSQH